MRMTSRSVVYVKHFYALQHQGVTSIIYLFIVEVLSWRFSELEYDNSLRVNTGWYLVTRLAVGM